MGDRFDYVTVTARLEERVVRGVTCEVEGYAGTDLSDSGFLGGILLGFAWRPRAGLELRARGGYGQALARDEEEEGAGSIALGLTLSW
jgi:hypothetical protein